MRDIVRLRLWTGCSSSVKYLIMGKFLFWHVVDVCGFSTAYCAQWFVLGFLKFMDVMMTNYGGLARSCTMLSGKDKLFTCWINYSFWCPNVVFVNSLSVLVLIVALMLTLFTFCMNAVSTMWSKKIFKCLWSSNGWLNSVIFGCTLDSCLSGECVKS